MRPVRKFNKFVLAPFAGRERRFMLKNGQIEELEELCKCGIGGIALRLGTHQFYAKDIWQTIRLGLEGGGQCKGLEATAIVGRYQDEEPLEPYVELAVSIIAAAFNGVPKAPPGEVKGEQPNESPATSPPSTEPAPPSASPLQTFAT